MGTPLADLQKRLRGKQIYSVTSITFNCSACKLFGLSPWRGVESWSRKKETKGSGTQRVYNSNRCNDHHHDERRHTVNNLDISIHALPPRTFSSPHFPKNALPETCPNLASAPQPHPTKPRPNKKPPRQAPSPAQP